MRGSRTRAPAPHRAPGHRSGKHASRASQDPVVGCTPGS